MSHDRGWRAACIVTVWIRSFHSQMHEVARGVTAMVVGSGALLATFSLRAELFKYLLCLKHAIGGSQYFDVRYATHLRLTLGRRQPLLVSGYNHLLMLHLFRNRRSGITTERIERALSREYLLIDGMPSSPPALLLSQYLR